MSRPSNPRLMARVLEAVKDLAEAKGSSARQVLELLRQGNKSPARNLAMQVQRALKNAVTAGLLQLRSGRYKMLISLEKAVKNRGGKINGNKTKLGKPGVGLKKKNDIEKTTDSGNSNPVEAGPRRRCSHCKKHKRRASKRRRKRSTKRRKRPTKQANERKSRRLRRRGEEEGANRREKRKKISSQGTRSKSEVPEREINPETNQEDEIAESATKRVRERSGDSSSGNDGGRTTRGKTSGTGRRNDSSSRRSGSKPRRNSKKRNKNLQNNDREDNGMDCSDGGQEILDEDDANACEHDAGSRTSI